MHKKVKPIKRYFIIFQNAMLEGSILGKASELFHSLLSDPVQLNSGFIPRQKKKDSGGTKK